MTSRLLRSQRLGLEGHFEGVLYVFESKAWQQEGYVSFEAYCAELYDDIDVRFPVLERREKVAEMTEKGATTREIGAALGIGAATAMRDQHALVSDETDDDESDAANQLDLVSDETDVEPLLDEPEPQVQDEEAVASEPALDDKPPSPKSDNDLLTELDRKRDKQKREQAERKQADVERFEQTARAVHALANISGPWMSDYDDALVDHYTREAFDRQRLLTAQAHLKELVAWSHNRTTGHSSSTR